MHWKNKKTILSILFLISLVGSIYLSLPLNNVAPTAIKIYYSTSQSNTFNITATIGNEIQHSIGAVQKHPISFVRFEIVEPFKGSWSQFSISFENFSREVDFWYDVGNGISAFNQTKSIEYQESTIPDYLLTAQFIKNGYVPIWSQIWVAQPTMSVITEPLLKETSFGVWEGEYFFDGTFTGTKLGDETYLNANMDKIVFQIDIPDNLRIENSESLGISKVNGAYRIIKEIRVSQTFHLVIKDPSKELIKNLILILTGLLLTTIFALFVSGWYKKSKRSKKS